MTRGCTEAWEARPDRASWFDLSRLPQGALVEFVDYWDIFDSGVIPPGVLCVVKEQGLNEMQPALVLKPQWASFKFLDHWDGEIWLYPPEDFSRCNFAEADEYAPAPVKIVEGRL
jgi:hypothetical protein